MSDREWAYTKAGRYALALLALSTVTVVWTLASAVRITPVPESAAAEIAGGSTLAAARPVHAVDVGAAVETDPFAADRSAPERAYRAPGEGGNDDLSTTAAALPVVLGTAVSDPAYSFATVQLGDSHATIMRVGGKIGEYTIKTIARGHVVFTTPSGKSLDIQGLKP